MYRFSLAMARVGIVLPLLAMLRVTVCLNVTTVLSGSKNGLDLLTAETDYPPQLLIDDDDNEYAATTKTVTVTISPMDEEEDDDDEDSNEASGDNLEQIDARNASSDFNCRRLTNNLAVEIRFVMAVSLIFTAVGFVILCGAIYFFARSGFRYRREYDLRRTTYVRLSDIGKIVRKSSFSR